MKANSNTDTNLKHVKTTLESIGLKFLGSEIEIEFDGLVAGDLDLVFSLGDRTLVFCEATDAKNSLSEHFTKKVTFYGECPFAST